MNAAKDASQSDCSNNNRSAASMSALTISVGCEHSVQVRTLCLTCNAKQVANRKCNERRGPGGCYDCYTRWMRGVPVSIMPLAIATNECLIINIHALTECQHSSLLRLD